MPSKTCDVLVTGAGGYLGHHVLAQLRRRNQRAVGTGKSGPGLLGCNLLDFKQVQKLIATTQPNVVVHCAAAMPSHSAGGYDDEDAAAANLRMVDNLIDAGASRIVFISSMTVYGPSLAMPVGEYNIAPQSAYGRTKAEAERRLQNDDRVTATILRLPGLFGPPRRSGLIYAICRAAVTQTTPHLPERPLLWAAMHVDDAAEIVCRAVKAFPSAGCVVNVGYPEKFSVSLLARQISSVTGREITCDVIHPEFEMDLTALTKSFGLPESSFLIRIAEMLRYASEAG
jgi:nucleoside-diphosphate-sugar epimerase